VTGSSWSGLGVGLLDMAADNNLSYDIVQPVMVENLGVFSFPSRTLWLRWLLIICCLCWYSRWIFSVSACLLQFSAIAPFFSQYFCL